LLAHYLPAAAPLLRKLDAFEPAIVCVLDPCDAEAGALMIALGRGRDLQEASMRAEATGHVPVVVMVTERVRVELALRGTRPALAAEIAAPVEMVGGVRVLCIAAGGASFAVALVALDAAGDAIAAEVPAVVDRLVETHGEQIRAAIDEAHPDGRRHVAIVDVEAATASGQIKVRLANTADIVAGLRVEDPQVAEAVAPPPELGFINVLFVMGDGGVFLRPLRLAAIAS
jgi:hypothetical protein